MCSNIEDAVCVYAERHLNLGYPPGCRGDACQVKLAQLVVVLGHGTLTLIHLGSAIRDDARSVMYA